MHKKKSDDHSHAQEMHQPCTLKAAERADEEVKLYGLPDCQAGNDLRDAGDDDDDVKQFLHGVVNGKIVVCDLEMQRFTHGLLQLRKSYRKQPLAKPARDRAVEKVGKSVDREEPHAREMPQQALCRPAAEPHGLGEMQPADDHIVIVDAPA